MTYNNPFSTDFPFIQPSYDIKGKVIDAYISYYDPTLNYKLPIKLASVSKTHIKLVDSYNTTLVDTDCTSKKWGNDYYILQSVTSSKIVFAFIITDIDTVITPTDGRLCLRCINMLPKHVTSISVQDSNINTLDTIELVYGNNVDMEYETDDTISIRPATLITINAGAGLGDGKIKANCTSTNAEEVYSINGVEVDETGNICLSADDCIAVSQTGTHILAIRDDCTPCCECKRFSFDAKTLDDAINDYYNIGASAELVRDSVSDLVDILKCGDVKLASDDPTYWPVRCYIDTTWQRKPAITAEFRNVMPAIVKGLKISVKVDCSPLCYHKALRTMYMEDVTNDDIYRDTQDFDNYHRISGIFDDSSRTSNSWTIDWSDRDIPPGGTIWCTVAARNGVSPKWLDAEPIIASVTATYTLEPTSCTEPSTDIEAKKYKDCINNIKAVNTSMASGTIKAGNAYNDNTGIITEDYIKKYEDNDPLKDSIYDACIYINGKDYKSAE